MEAKTKTINIIKETRKVPKHVSDSRKQYVQIRKTILEALKDEGKTIPQIAKETNTQLDVTTYYLMSLIKFGEIAVEGIDDMDEYIIYKLKK
jgi:predicted transcriptional regulator